jgi:hypothetical protein
VAGHAWSTFTDAWTPDVRATLPLYGDEAVLLDAQMAWKSLYYPLTLAVFQYLSQRGYRRTLRDKHAEHALVHMCNVLADAGITLTRKKLAAMG